MSVPTEGAKIIPGNPVPVHPERAYIVPRNRVEVRFCGWHLWHATAGSYLDATREYHAVSCDYALHNPEKPGAVFSFRQWDTYPSMVPAAVAAQETHVRLRESCAWLIAHWWDHYVAACPCLKTKAEVGDNAETLSHFGQEIFETLMQSDEEVTTPQGDLAK